MKVFVTKFSLSQGILEIDVPDSAVSNAEQNGGTLVISDCAEQKKQMYLKSEWYTDRVLAILDVRSREFRKAASLEVPS